MEVHRFYYHSWCDSTVIFLLNQKQQQFLPQFQSILDGQLSYLLRAPFSLEIENITYKRLVGAKPHSHMPFAPILVFMSTKIGFET
jgi:hypothetical protein